MTQLFEQMCPIMKCSRGKGHCDCDVLYRNEVYFSRGHEIHSVITQLHLQASFQKKGLIADTIENDTM
jgi:hypothetical protein